MARGSAHWQTPFSSAVDPAAGLAPEEKAHGIWHLVSAFLRAVLLRSILAAPAPLDRRRADRHRSPGRVTDAGRRRRRSRRRASCSPAPPASRPPTAKGSTPSATSRRGATRSACSASATARRREPSAVADGGDRDRSTSPWTAAPVQLDEIVSTATGEQRKLEVGNAVTTIDAAKVAEHGADHRVRQPDLGPRGRRAGAQEQRHHRHRHPHPHPRAPTASRSPTSRCTTSTASGSRAARARRTLDIGGFGDGDRRTPGPRASTTSIPDDIEYIEIVKGPAAATLYGIQASNGVVRITTKHGTAGPPRWNLFTEVGAVSDNNTYPLNYYGRVDTRPTGGSDAGFDGFCTIQSELDGACIQTPLQTLPAAQQRRPPGPTRRACGRRYGANVSGGSDQVTYYVSGAYENEIGPFRLPKFEEDSIRARPAARSRTTRSARTRSRSTASAPTCTPTSRQDVRRGRVAGLPHQQHAVHRERQQLPHGERQRHGERRTCPRSTAAGSSSRPQLFAELANQAANRFTGGFTGNWHPREWLTGRATIGYDVVARPVAPRSVASCR